MLRTFKDLLVWQRSFELVATTYEITRGFPNDEKFGLVSQMRRSAVSVPSNIAEGYARDTTQEYVRHLWIAKGSLAELETQLLIAQRLEYISEPASETVANEIEEIERMLAALIRKLKGKLS